MLPEFSVGILGMMAFGGLTMCMTLLTVLLWLNDRDVAIRIIHLPLVLLAMTFAVGGRLAPAITILGVLTLIHLRGYLLRRWGNYTLACLIFRQHEWCEDHLKCECPHHDEYIHREMAK